MTARLASRCRVARIASASAAAKQGIAAAPTRVVIELDGVPVGKGRPRISTWNGVIRAYTPDKTRAYEAALRDAAIKAMAGRAPMVGSLDVTVSAIFPMPLSWSRAKRDLALSGELRPTVRPDIDNVLKTLDALNGIAWHDDKQIVSAKIAKVYGPAACVVIEIVEIRR